MISATQKNSPKLTKTQFEQILSGSLEIFREETGRKDLPMQVLIMFMAVGDRGEYSVNELKKWLPKLSHSAVSRNVAILCGSSITRQDCGLDLCESRPDDNDKRYKLIKLTQKGKALREKMFANATHLLDCN